MAVNVTDYWAAAPPIPSPKLAAWVQRIARGWRPNRRVRAMGYHEAAEFFDVYIWEYLNVIRPALEEQ